MDEARHLHGARAHPHPTRHGVLAVLMVMLMLVLVLVLVLTVLAVLMLVLTLTRPGLCTRSARPHHVRPPVNRPVCSRATVLCVASWVQVQAHQHARTGLGRVSDPNYQAPYPPP